eukprot:2661582-Ditylum_brightwellii.AAC.1
MASAAKAELGALFEITKEAVALCNILEEVGHKQPTTFIQGDNLVANSIEPDKNNKADYFTKHHPPAHHQKLSYSPTPHKIYSAK